MTTKDEDCNYKIIKRGCPTCGHGLMVFDNGSTHCVWEDIWKQ